MDVLNRMEGNSLVTGMKDATIEDILGLAYLTDLSFEQLALIESALLFVGVRDGVVSVQSVQAELGERLKVDSLKTLFFALSHAGVLTRQERDRRGYAYDRYHVDSSRLHQIMQQVALVRRVLAHLQVKEEQAGRVELVATLPDTLPLNPEIRRSISSLAAALHRLISEAEKEVIILSPFFET